ncbi:MAG: iron uptake porin, partial [Waterburya sp.]
MKIKFKQKIKLGIIVITSFFNTSAALANNIESIPAVSKLKNIHTGDWEYQALQSLAQRYSCTEQWQNNQSNLPLSRYEFAVGLNHCLQQIDTISSQQDLTILHRLQQDFAPELARLTNKVAQVEANITQLESEQFSTTTK